MVNKRGMIPAVICIGLLGIFIFGGVVCRNHRPRTAHGVPIYEIYPETEIPVRRSAVRPPSLRPRIAIIIDDMGYDLDMARELVRLDSGITFSILPRSPYQQAVMDMLRKSGSDIMLHLPMEPKEYPQVDPGPGAIYTSMSPRQIAAIVNENLDRVSMAKGVNNHMGSKMSEFAACMYTIMSVLKKRRLFYVDSVTSPKSVCYSTARTSQIPFAQRDVFLDHKLDAGTIERQIQRLMDVALQHGEAIGIGHPHPQTYQVLRKMLPRIKKKFLLSPVSQLVHMTG